MTAEQIRHSIGSPLSVEYKQVLMLAEIAIQLAELNEHFRSKEVHYFKSTSTDNGLPLVKDFQGELDKLT